VRPGKPVGIEQVDALIIGGGADVSPALYGQTRRLPMGELADRGVAGWRRAIGYVLFPLLWLLRRLMTKSTGGLDPDRDALEQRLIGQALDAGMPMLGICRGMQLINVARAGSLHQSLEGFYDEVPEIRSVLPRKRVALVEGSRLAAILGAAECRVNALHRQAIDRLGDELTPAAREPNGVLQAFEGRGRTWLIGVQWHPEYLPQRAEQRALFRALVEAAETRS
jgi:putative glutamine amidotransferase